MKAFVIFAACSLPVAAFAQQSYTNADLAKFSVPGAYTNQDLKRLSPLPMQKAPAAQVPPYVAPPVPSEAFQATYDTARDQRDFIAAEIEYEKGLVDFSESAFAGDTRSFDVRLGYRAAAAVYIRDLERQRALYEARMEQIADDARKAGATIDRR